MKSTPSVAPKPKHWLLAKLRQWHLWGGLLAGLFLLLVAASGIVLNYKQPIFSVLGLEKKYPKPEESSGELRQQPARLELTTRNGTKALPVSLEQALQLAHAQWGDVPLERIELKAERGGMLYKLKQKGGEELWVNAVTGTHLVKGEYERVSMEAGGGPGTRSTDWGKILIDLHTGKIGGEFGKAVMSGAALLLLLLSLSGVYMWLKPILIRRQNAKAKIRVRAPDDVTAPPTLAASRNPQPMA
jgi:uncharacterized iron-regulated membrane protein